MDISHMQSQQLKQKLCQAQTSSLQILSMNNFELKEYLQAEQMENPLLEIREPDTAEETYAIGRWLSDHDEADPYQSDDEQESQYDIPDHSGALLTDYLKDQIRCDELKACEQKLLRYIIDLIDTSTGFLTTPIREIAYLSGASTEAVVKCVKYLQTLEPAGIGAESLRQCLIIQAERLGCTDKKLIDMIKYFLEDVAAKRYRKISEALGISRQQTTRYVELIKSLNPRPSRGFGDSATEYIIPDVLLSCQFDQWEITLNDRWMGSIGINKLYKSYVNNVEDENVREYLKGKINRARFIIKCIEQRRDTLLKVSDFILKKQLDYITGAGYLKPMNLNDVADEFGIHISTVSRTLKDKYLQTPRGIYPFKHFFVGKTNHNPAEDEEAVSSAKAKAVLMEIVHKENKCCPLSDSALARELLKHGIALSRRTVAKYREALGLPNAAERQCS